MTPFLRFTGYRFQDASFSSTETVTGWGHITIKPNPGNVRGHGINYGIPLLIAAAVLLVALVTVLVARSVEAAGLVGSALLAGVGLVGLLDYDAESSFTSNAGKYSVGAGLVLMVVLALLGLPGRRADARRRRSRAGRSGAARRRRGAQPAGAGR